MSKNKPFEWGNCFAKRIEEKDIYPVQIYMSWTNPINNGKPQLPTNMKIYCVSEDDKKINVIDKTQYHGNINITLIDRLEPNKEYIVYFEVVYSKNKKFITTANLEKLDIEPKPQEFIIDDFGEVL